MLGHRRLRQRLLPLDQRQGLQRHGDLAGAPQGRAVRQPLLHPDPPHLHPGQRRAPVEADADERVAAQRRPRLGAQGDGRRAPARATSPRTSATTSWSASTRASATWCRATSPAARPRTSATRSAASARPGWASTSTSPTRSTGSAATAVAGEYGNLFDMYERITGRGPVRGPDAHLPGRALHDGRAVGRLRPAEHHPGPVRDRRGELLRPRREPARRLGADAGPGRRLLRAADHHRRLPRRRASSPRSRDDAPEVAEAEARGAARLDRLLSIDGHRTVDSFHRELGQLMWDYCGMERTDEGLRKALDRIPELRREFWSEVKVPGVGGDAEPVAGEGRPRRRLPRARRADVPRRAAPHRELRRPLPGGEPDRRRRGAARRRELLLRRRLGVHGPGPGPGPPQGGPRLRVRHPQPAELHSEDSKLQGLAPGRPGRQGPPGRLPGRRRRRGHVVPRADRRPQREADPRRRGAGRVRPGLP